MTQHRTPARLASRKISVVDVAIYLFLILLAVIMVFPFYNMILVSVADYVDIIETQIYVYPKSIDLQNYRMALLLPNFVNSALVSVFVTVVGTLLSMVVTTLGAYVLSRRNFPLKGFFFYFIVFTMYFGAGLIPWYLVMKELGLINNIWGMVIPPLINTFYLILMRNYFQSIPPDIEESARIDGANDIQILVNILVPISAPIIATISLFYAVDRWNDWWLGMILIQDPKLMPLQLLLRNLVIANTLDLGSDMMNIMRTSRIQVHSRSLQMAVVTITTIPILLVYPFLQKHFTKGILLGSIKA
ncbi:MAG: carbohydrate ABC transporter permease [Anaerolineae bacterium]|nr:carbohydrate ABC transporter permease [Candidatus Roseilinea sp.]MDW8450612.1 carbohydrate ABC transporter permease [Anaerolineae bacterium]